MNLDGHSLIAGGTGRSETSSFRAINPATGERLAPDFFEASADEVTRAMTAAADAFAHYRMVPARTRALLLDGIAEEIEAIGDPLLERAQAETGLPPARLKGERARTCGQLRLFAEVVREGSWVDARIDRALPDRQPLPRPDLRRMLIPVGPVVVFGSSNFPFAFSVAGGDTASAFAAGCPVVVKAHRSHPGTAELVGRAIQRAAAALALPPGVFSLIHGGGATVGIAMVRHPATAAVGFTGSHTAGRALFDAAAARPHPIPVFAEMSSLNPVFLLPGALRERPAAIAEGLAASFTLGVGQFCTKPGLVFTLDGSDTDAFLEALRNRVETLPCATMLSPGIRDAFEEHRGTITAAKGVSIIARGKSEAVAARMEGQPSVAMTTAAEFLRTPAMATEAFGPFTLVIRARDPAELAACAGAVEGQLTATVHATAEDLRKATALLAELERRAGRIVINGFPTGVEVCPAMHHGGPYPATTDVRFTSVGTAALLRFARPVCYQGLPDEFLPPQLQNANPDGILRLVDGRHSREPIRPD